MTPEQLDAYLYRHIPLTRAMEVRTVRTDGGGLRFVAPLAPNINDKGTAFAGSLASLLTLAGWALTHSVLQQAGITAPVAVSESTLRYRRPVTGELVIDCPSPGEDAVAELVARMQRRGKASWWLSARVGPADDPCVRIDARYASWLEPDRR